MDVLDNTDNMSYTDNKNKKRVITQKCREGYKKWNEQRQVNKTLTQLNKNFSKTEIRKFELKEELLNNPAFIDTYNTMYQLWRTTPNHPKLTDHHKSILAIFDYKPI
jgi:hypothetical protein